MPRIFKGSESTLRLLISKTGDYQALTGIKIKLYTTDIENAIEIIDGIQVCKNIAIITLAPRAFMGMEDGLINYIIDGATEDDVFHTERQSNYMLKSLSYINEDGVATQTMTIESNGEYRVTPNDGLYVDINVNVPDLNGSYDDGFNVGYGQGKTDGVNEQKLKLESINITENGTYTKEDGYNHIEVNVPDLNGSYDEGYAQGKTDGANEQKSKLESISITENGTYTKEDGYNQIEVNVPDLNGSYDDGFNVGYEQGKTDGVNEQKSKLETINITENGTYTKEDGYNHIEVNVTDLNGSYDEGYEQGQADVAVNARVLNVTENGNYLSKFSDPVTPTLVTGVYDDGTEFYNYAELGNKVFNTNITVTQDSVVELWYKGDNKKTNDGWNTIFGCAKNDDDDFYLGYMYSDNTNLRGWIGQKQVQFSWDDNVWHHIIMKNDGLWVDDVLMGSFNTTKTFAYNLGLNGTWNSLIRNANGCFGMIKIDDVIIIPTADGFKNVNTGELLEVVKDGSYTFTENLPIYGEGELYKTINVNVIPKINLQKTGLKFGYSSFTEVPEWVDFEGVTDMYSMFQECGNLQTIPQFDTSKVTNMDHMFYNCNKLQTIPQFDTSKVTNMGYMFYNCRNLQTIPLIDTSKVTSMYNMFYSCQNLQTIPQFNTSNVNDMTNTFAECYSLTSLPALNAQSLNMWSFLGVFGNNELSKLTDFGGFLNLKLSLIDDDNLKRLPNLTYQSCINVLNGLYDFTGNGETPNSNQGKLKVHANFLTTVGDEISIGTAKGWTITA